MLRFLFIALIVASAGFDCQTTVRRIRKYGIDIELNPVMRGAAALFGVWPAAILLLMLPNLLLTLLFALYSYTLLTFFAGARACFLVLQITSIRVEKMLDSLKPPHETDAPSQSSDRKVD